MTDQKRKTPCPEYDESIVQRLPYITNAHENPGRFDGGFYAEGRRNPYPGGSDGDPLLTTVAQYGGLGSLAALMAEGAADRIPRGFKRCSGCRRVLPLSKYDAPVGYPNRLRSRCNDCVAYDRRRHAAKRARNG